MAQADPAFLFYSRDFYEGTRMMLPEERACYIDLMIYQHQHGFIPSDTRRMMLYCGGVSEAVLIAVLEAKFKQCESGWYNERLQKVIEDREDYKDKQSKNGKIGQFYKKSKALLSASNYKKLCQVVDSIGINDVICRINVKEMDKAMLEALLKHLEDANAIEDINNDIEDKEEEEEEDISASDSSSQKPKPFNFLKALIGIGVSEQVAKDWIAVRKAKKATGTETAFNRIHEQIKKSGLTADECISIAVERNWQGFNADWINGQSKQLPPPNINKAYERWDAASQTRYFGTQVIPYDAPPRPSNLEKWDDKNKKWYFSMN